MTEMSRIKKERKDFDAAVARAQTPALRQRQIEMIEAFAALCLLDAPGRTRVLRRLLDH